MQKQTNRKNKEELFVIGVLKLLNNQATTKQIAERHLGD